MFLQELIKSAVENDSLLLMHLLHLQNIKTPGETDNLIIIEQITNNITSFVSKLVFLAFYFVTNK